MEIFHGGYFESYLDGTKKYKVPSFVKTGGKVYLDGLYENEFSWVDLNNIAYTLGYRELPISYYFKQPRTSANVGWIEILGEGEAKEMVNMIPKKKRQISVYITGGGPRRYAEALDDFYRDPDPNWENPLTKPTQGEKNRNHFEANLRASQLCSSAHAWENGQVNEGNELVNENCGPSEGTFVGLSDIVMDLDMSEDLGVEHVGKRSNRLEDSGKEEKNAGKKVKQCGRRSCPPGYKDELSRNLEEIRQKERKEAERKEREDLEMLIAEQYALRERQASVGLSKEELVTRAREEEERRQQKAIEQAVREASEKWEKEAAEKRAFEAAEVRRQLYDELEERNSLEKKKGKRHAGGSRANKSGRKPKDGRYKTRKNVQKQSAVVEYDDDNSTDDSEFYVDSDYDLDHDEFDDKEFLENVVEPSHIHEYLEMGYEGYCSDENVNSDELESLSGSDTEEDEDGNKLMSSSVKLGGVKLTPWIRSVDIKNPYFKVGLAFPNPEQCREAVRECAIRNQVGLYFEKNSRKKILAKCQWGCPFRVYASKVKGLGDTMVVKTLNNSHKCSPVETSHFLTYRRIAAEVKNRLLVDECWSRKGIHCHILEKYNLDVGVQTITRAKKCARRINEGHYIDQYNKLAAYRKEMLRSNPGSTVLIKTQMDGPVRRFHRMYICFKACKDGWIAGCRPLICCDGCHIKGQHPGQLLTAVGVDANNGMFPVAYALVESEDQQTWTWFLESLKEDLNIENSKRLVFMTDKQKGLGNAIADLYPDAEHRHCVRHLYNNFKLKHPGEGLKQSMWNAARSSTVPWYNKHMDDLRVISQEAFDWFKDKNPRQWSRAFFVDESKCDILLNNLCESFNSALLPFRDKPVLTMLEKIRMDMMIRNANRRVACEKWNTVIGPRIKKTLDKIGERATQYKAYRGSEYEFQVIGSGENGSKHAVDLGLHTCTCKRWQLSGMPCVHAICAIRFKKHDVALYCDDYLVSSSYLRTYTPAISPIAGEDDWESVDFPIAPPPYKKQAGRPKMKRNKEAGEKNNTIALPAPVEEKLGKTGIKMSCRVCGQQGHNKLGCPITKAKKSTTTGEGTSSGANSKKRVRAKVNRAAAPLNGRCNVQDQVIKSRKGWMKRKAVEEGTSTMNGSARTLTQYQQLPTQCSQNLAARNRCL